VISARVTVLLAATAMACAPEPVTIDVNFPSDRAFLFSEAIEVHAYEVSTAELGGCASLVGQLLTARAANEAPVLRSNPLRACTVLAGGMTFDDVPEGPLAWVGLAKDANRTLLAGCTVAEVYADAPVVTIHMFMTADYRMAVRNLDPAWRTIDEKCGR
jgi:hypothetical protein